MPANEGVDKLPYPLGSEIPDGPGAFLALAQRVTKMKGSGIALVADATARAALVTATDAYEDLLVWQADTNTLWLYTSSAWLPILSDVASYTPALTNMVIGTGGSANGALLWHYAGPKLVHVFGTLILGSSGMSMGSIPTMALPVTAAAPSIPYQLFSDDCTINDVSAASVTPFQGAIVANNGSTTTAILRNGAGTNITAAVPMTWAAGDAIWVDFYYRIP